MLLQIRNAAADPRIRAQTIRPGNRLNFVKANDWDRAMARLVIIMNVLISFSARVSLFTHDEHALRGKGLRVLDSRETKAEFP